MTIQPQDKYVLRLPDGLRDQIKASAEAEGRSMNSEIVLILQRHYAQKAKWREDVVVLDASAEEARAIAKMADDVLHRNRTTD